MRVPVARGVFQKRIGIEECVTLINAQFVEGNADFFLQGEVDPGQGANQKLIMCLLQVERERTLVGVIIVHRTGELTDVITNHGMPEGHESIACQDEGTHRLESLAFGTRKARYEAWSFGVDSE